MKNVKVKKSELIEKVELNKSKHREIFEEALDGYKQEMLKHLSQMISDVEKGTSVDHHIPLVKPINHLQDYDAAISMLKMSVEEHVELDIISFRNLVMDNWGWKEDFIISNTRYTKSK